MKKLTTIVILISSLASLTACEPPAKEEMLKKMEQTGLTWIIEPSL